MSSRVQTILTQIKKPLVLTDAHVSVSTMLWFIIWVNFATVAKKRFSIFYSIGINAKNLSQTTIRQ